MKYLYTLIPWLLVINAGAAPPVISNIQTEVAADSTATLTLSYTVASGTDVLGVCASVRFADPAQTTVTYGATPLTKAVDVRRGTVEAAEMWYLLNPTPGTQTITVTFGAADFPNMVAYSMSTAVQGAPDNGSVAGFGGVTTAVVNVTATDALLVDCLTTGNTSTNTPQETGQVAQEQITSATTGTGLSTKPETSTGNSNMTWDTSGSAALVAVAWHEGTAPPPVTSSIIPVLDAMGDI